MLPCEYTPFLYNQISRSKSDAGILDPSHMLNLFFNDSILYKCSCGTFKRLYSTYFCRHCMALRCRDCVSHEVDSQYCQHCLEYIPTIDPKFQKNKCASCYHCPSCFHLLSTTTLSISQPGEDASSGEAIKKTCQLTCAFCRWSSETFTIFEASKVTNDLPEIEVPNIKRLEDLFEYFKALAQKEKSDKEKRRFHPRSGNAMHLLDKYGISASLSPKLTASLRAKSYQGKTALSAQYNSELKNKISEDKAISGFVPPVATDIVEPLNAQRYYDNDFNLEMVSSIEQRLAQVELQPESLDSFRPISKSLSVKRSLRCKTCEHNLCRSEYSPVSIKFKIQLSAYYHVPELKFRPKKYPNLLKVNEINLIEMTIQNQTPNQVQVTFGHSADAQDDKSYELTLPPGDIKLGPKDETAEFEHIPMELVTSTESNQSQVLYQKLYKAGFFLKVKPLSETVDLRCCFNMSHDIVVLQSPRDADRIEKMTHSVMVSLGKVVA